MHLPLRLAASLTVTIGMMAGLAFGLLNMSKGNLIPASVKMSQVGGAVLLVGFVMLPLVIPNIAGAAVGNRAAHMQSALWVPAFAGAFLTVWFLQGAMLQKWLGSFGGLYIDWSNWRLWAAFAVNLLICACAAAWHGQQSNG